MMLRQRKSRPRPSARLAFEVLEDRSVPSGVDVVSADPNDWPMFGHDPEGTRYNVAEQQLSPATVAGLQEMWRFPTDGAVLATPAVVNDIVYSADDAGSVYALTRDGDLLWKTTLDVPTFMSAKIAVSPVVTNRTVVIGDAAGQIHGLDVKTGEVRWTTRPPNPGPIFGDQHPFQVIAGAGTMVGNYVAFGVSSFENFFGPLIDPNYPGFTFRGNVVMIDPADGRIVWQTFTVDEATQQPDGSFGPNGATIWGSPAYDRASNTLFVGTGQHYGPPTTNTSDALIALDAATGAIRWVSQKTPDDTWNITYGPPSENDLDIGDSPQLYRLNGRLVVAAGQKSGFFHVVDAATGEAITPPQQFQTPGGLGGFHIDSAVAGGVNYAPGNTWAWSFGPPSEADSGAIVAISGDGSNQLWRYELESPIIAGVAVANGVVYAQETDGTFHAINAATGQGLAQVETGVGMCGPAISRGQIYLGDGNVQSVFDFFGQHPPGYIVALGLLEAPGQAPTAASGAFVRASAGPTVGGPTLKGPLAGTLDFNAATGLATFDGSGHLTLMGKVAVHGEFLFAPGDVPGSLVGTGVAVFTAANGDVLVANVVWYIEPDGEGRLEFRWPDEITLRDGTRVRSTGRFVELPFAGLRGTSTVDRLDVDWGDGIVGASIKMTGEIVDPDPLD